MSDLIPREGKFFGVPLDAEEVNADHKEKAKVLEVAEFIEAEMDWCDTQIDETNRMTNLETESKVPIESQVMAYQLLADLLTKKKGELQAIADQYIKR